MKISFTSRIVSLLLCVAVTTNAQDTQSAIPIIRDDNNCESNKAYFDNIAVTAGTDGLVIIIARLGDGDTSRTYNRRRLHNIRTYLNYIREIIPERIITAEGERVRGRGRIEVYIGGRLFIVFTVGPNQDLAGGECEMRSSDLFYPMRRRRCL